MMKTELIVALDIPDLKTALNFLRRLPPSVRWSKVGLELFSAAGPEAVSAITATGRQVFLDLKLHDIPNTVGRTVAALARCGAAMVTIHAAGGPAMISAAAQAASSTPIKIIAVTTLTSLDQSDLASIGLDHYTPSELTRRLAILAVRHGADGIVAAPTELPHLRKELGPRPIIITPGIRPSNSPSDDQKRTATPAAAVRDGASFLVVGRPIVQADDPAEAAQRILAEMQEA